MRVTLPPFQMALFGIIEFADNLAIGSNGTVSTGFDGTVKVASMGNPKLGNPRRLTIAWEVSGAATITLQVSYDGGATWVQATLLGTTTEVSVVESGAGGRAVAITPAPLVQLTSSAAVTLSAWAYATN